MVTRLLRSLRVAAALVALVAAAAGAPGRNILLFVADDLGYADIGANNPDAFYETPNIDRLAASGVRFTNAYATCPVCSPSRYSLMTGRLPVRAHVTDWFTGRRTARFLHAEYGSRMPLAEVTLAEALRERGYRTFFAGKWHLGESPDHWPDAQGFEENHGGHGRGSPPGGYFAPYNNPRLADGPDGEHLPWRLAREACDFLERRRGASMFVCLSFYEVHNPRQAPERLIAKYQAKAARLGLDPAGRFEHVEQVWQNGEPRRNRLTQSHPVYAAMVESLDTAVGMVLDKLEQLGLEGETIVCFTSDNGGLSTAEGHNTSNRPLAGGKGWLYEGGIRVPLLVRAPGVSAAGSVSAVPATGADLYPTLLDLAGAPPRPAQHLDGVSIVNAFKGEPVSRGPLFWHYPHYSNQGGFPGAAIRDGDWKLIERHEDGRVELYHLANDPGERRNLAGQRPRRVERLRERLHEWYRGVDARFLRPKGDAAPWRPPR